MNFQPIIDNLPMLIAALGFLLWAAARLVESKAKSDPAVDKWDLWAPRIKWASDHYSEAIDWLVSSGVLKLKGAEKLAELNRLVAAFEAAIVSGDYLKAINSVVGFWVDAKNKAIAANPSMPELTENTPAL